LARVDARLSQKKTNELTKKVKDMSTKLKAVAAKLE
jgi:hypothetical protein